jgi:hypothetical protein
MVETLCALLGIAVGLIGALIYNAKKKGMEELLVTQLTDNMEKAMEEINGVKSSVTLLEKSYLLQQQQLTLLIQEQNKFEKLADGLNENLNINNQQITKLGATMEGVKNLLENIFNGNLQIRRS